MTSWWDDNTGTVRCDESSWLAAATGIGAGDPAGGVQRSGDSTPTTSVRAFAAYHASDDAAFSGSRTVCRAPPGRHRVRVDADNLRLTVAALRSAGCIAAEEEAAELAAAASDQHQLRELLKRRCTGEPLAWLLGRVDFCGERVIVTPGVYVPRWQTEKLAREAAARLPAEGVAVDLCTGSGAVAVVMRRLRPKARVLGTEVDPSAAACARANGVEVFEGDLDAGLPAGIRGLVDVVTAVVPYVPTSELAFLPRDVTTYEPVAALDGGRDGLRVLVPSVTAASRLLRPGGSLLLEVGGDQARQLAPVLRQHGFSTIRVSLDEEGDLRAVYCRRDKEHSRRRRQ